MVKPPVILVSPSIEKKGEEFGDRSISLSETYQQALMGAGGIPLTLPATVSREVVAHSVAVSDGVLLTGGEDIDPAIFGAELPPRLRRTVTLTEDGGARDYREMMLVDEVFRQRKPLLAICRRHQVVNVALGGTLVADIDREMKGAANHKRMDKRSEVVHEVRLTDDSLLAKITGRQMLGVNSTHHQAVAKVAPPLLVTARSADGVIEGLGLRPDAAHLLPFFVTVQFHPERLVDRYPEHSAIFRAFTQACVLSRNSQL